MVGERGEHGTVFTWGLLSAAIKHISRDGGWGGFRHKCAMQRKYFEFPKKPAGKVPSIQDWSRKAVARSLQTGALCEESSQTCCRPPPCWRGQRPPFLCSASSVLDIPAMRAERARSPAICKMWACPLQNPHRCPSKAFPEVSQYLRRA